MTKYPDLFASLASEFEEHEVKLRQAPGGRQLHYITARTAMNRLDNVLGPENWWDEYLPLEHSVVCRLTIVLPDGKEVTKCDAGGYAGMADQGDDDKSGFSDAFKRACAKFGVGRYLYRDGVPEFVSERAGTPKIPSGQSYTEAPRQQPAPAQRQSQGGQKDQAPRSGKALFAFLKEQEQKLQVGILKYINNWAKLQEFPSRIIDFDADQTALAYAAAVKKLQSVSDGDQEEDRPVHGGRL